MNIDTQDLISALTAYVLEHQSIPTVREYVATRARQQHGPWLPDESTIRTRFGGWNPAWRAAMQPVIAQATRNAKTMAVNVAASQPPNAPLPPGPAADRRARKRWDTLGPYPVDAATLRRRLTDQGLSASEAEAAIQIAHRRRHLIRYQGEYVPAEAESTGKHRADTRPG